MIPADMEAWKPWGRWTNSLCYWCIQEACREYVMSELGFEGYIRLYQAERQRWREMSQKNRLDTGVCWAKEMERHPVQEEKHVWGMVGSEYVQGRGLGDEIRGLGWVGKSWEGQTTGTGFVLWLWPG